MASKSMRLQIGGQERSMKFGNMLFFKYAGEVYKGDPMELVYGISTVELLKVASAAKGKNDVTELLTGISDPIKLYNIIYAFVYAGLKCAGENVNAEDVNTWVADLDFSEGAEILKQGRAALVEKTANESATGEINGQTIKSDDQQQAIV